MLLCEAGLTLYKLLGGGSEGDHILLVAGFGLGAHHRLGAGKLEAQPRAVFENQLKPVGAHDFRYFSAVEVARLFP